MKIYNLFVIVKPIAASDSDSKIGSNFLSVLAKLAKVLSSAKLWTEAIVIQEKVVEKNIK